MSFITVNYLVPKSYADLEEVTVTIHPPGVMPYLDQFKATTKLIPRAKHLEIGVEALITNVTEGFASLDLRDRQCQLNMVENRPYSEINCRMDKNIDQSIKECQCVPWFYKSTGDVQEAICTANQMICFDEMMYNLSINTRPEECPKACVYSGHDLTYQELSPEKGVIYSKMRTGRGQAWEDFLSESNKGMPVYDGVTIQTPHGRQLINQIGLVEVNFDHQLATVIMKDAKMTFEDKVGSIGGTFGVFLGLSIVGILDFLILICTCIKEKFF